MLRFVLLRHGADDGTVTHFRGNSAEIFIIGKRITLCQRPGSHIMKLLLAVVKKDSLTEIVEPVQINHVLDAVLKLHVRFDLLKSRLIQRRRIADLSKRGQELIHLHIKFLEFILHFTQHLGIIGDPLLLDKRHTEPVHHRSHQDQNTQQDHGESYDDLPVDTGLMFSHRLFSLFSFQFFSLP